MTRTDTAAAAAPGRLPELLGRRRVACAESCTAGRLVAELPAIGDAAEWLTGSIVAYQTAVKRELLGVSADSVVTAEAASEMATGVASLLGADVAVATTGVLGAEAIDGIAPGTVFIATAVDSDIRTIEHHVDGDADQQCSEAVAAAHLQLLEHLAARPGQTVTSTAEPARV